MSTIAVLLRELIALGCTPFKLLDVEHSEVARARLVVYKEVIGGRRCFRSLPASMSVPPYSQGARIGEAGGARSSQHLTHRLRAGLSHSKSTINCLAASA